MTATAVPAKDASVAARDAALQKRQCYGVPACCLAFDPLTQTFPLFDCIEHPPANCGSIGHAQFCCDPVGAISARDMVFKFRDVDGVAELFRVHWIIRLRSYSLGKAAGRRFSQGRRDVARQGWGVVGGGQYTTEGQIAVNVRAVSPSCHLRTTRVERGEAVKCRVTYSKRRGWRSGCFDLLDRWRPKTRGRRSRGKTVVASWLCGMV